MDGLGLGAVAVSIIAVIVALWQGWISKQQLELAKSTEQRTEATLAEIRRETNETRQVTQDIKSNIDERITKILDSKLAAEQQSQATSTQVSQMLMQKMMEGFGGAGRSGTGNQES